MFLYRGINTPHVGRSWRSRLVSVLPWVFVLGMAAGSLLPLGNWHGRLGLPSKTAEELQRERDSETIWRRAGNPQRRHAVEVLRTVDGDTFDARVALWPGVELNTRVRLRGIDAPELHAQCECGIPEGRSVDESLARDARRRRRRDLQHRPGQVWRPRRRGRLDAEDAERVVGAGRRGHARDLSERPAAGLVLVTLRTTTTGVPTGTR